MPDPVVARSLVERLLHDARSGLRLVHDVSILTDVWAAFAARPEERVSVLLSPAETTTPPRAAMALAEALRDYKDPQSSRPPAHVSPLQGFVAADLAFDELLFALAPLIGLEIDILTTEAAAKVLERIEPLENNRRHEAREHAPDRQERLSALATLILHARHFDKPVTTAGEAAAAIRRSDRLAAMIFSELGWQTKTKVPDTPRPVFRRATLNRQAQPLGAASIRTIKADAARRVFEAGCRDLLWAVIDSGIDATHPAFRDPENLAAHRIVGAYDFARLRRLTSYDILLEPDGAAFQALEADIARWRQEAPPAADTSQDATQDLTAVELLEQMRRDAQQERPFSWTLLEPLLRIAPKTPPREPHGTHVAGVLAGHWPEADLIGVCPDLRLLDLRVLGDTRDETEFGVIGALEFIAWLNNRNRYRVVHGVNLSIGMKHDVRNWACGQTPVCVACDTLVDNGVVVVAAAGNEGWQSFLLSEQRSYEGYASASITDPGNAESVITVGATHRERPMTYGVSFFSSRGPTGDGRMKPDLVAPGEKIDGPLPDEKQGQLDGTSMAAPHVSGVAALLMARRIELVGDPVEVKNTLMATATDLRRERAFQGAGLVDALRALQWR